MPSGRRPTLAAASAAVGVACAVSPLLTWLSAGGRRHCGWTCDGPAAQAPSVASLPGRGGTQVAVLLAVLFVVVAVLAALGAIAALRSAGPPPALGWAVVVTGFSALVWTVLVIVRYAEGGTLVRTPRDGVFAADPALGAVVGLVAGAAAVLLGGLVALRPAQDGSPPTPPVRHDVADESVGRRRHGGAAAPQAVPAGRPPGGPRS